MAPAGSPEAKYRSMSTCDCRHSAKSRTAQTRAGTIDRPRSPSYSDPEAVAHRSSRPAIRRHKGGTCTTAMRHPPIATPSAADRTPQLSPMTSIVMMIATLYAM